eukprot:COSAG01_NODE_641_length_14573_cov_17.634637_8_plen_126_part_00
MCFVICSNKLFSVLNCRTLSEEEAVLVANYDVSCLDSMHERIQLISACMIIMFSFGVPLGMLVILRLNYVRKMAEFDNPSWRWIQQRATLQLCHKNQHDVKHCIIDVALGTQYGSLVSTYKPAFL